MIVWAPLTKSPNCASQQHQRLGVGHRVAVLEAERGVLRQQRVVDEELAPARRSRCSSGVYSAPVLRSTSTECRCTNVPRRESWPASRTGTPSSSSEPKASSSPKAQSMLPSLAIAARRSSCGCSRGCDVEALRQRDVRVADPLERLRRDRRVDRPAAGVRGSCPAPAWPGPDASAGLREHPLQLVLVVAQGLLGLLEGDVAAADQRLGVELPDRALLSMMSYISGWVIDGSSPSLWPRRR